jgi:hypothetical protein
LIYLDIIIEDTRGILNIDWFRCLAWWHTFPSGMGLAEIAVTRKSSGRQPLAAGDPS